MDKLKRGQLVWYKYRDTNPVMGVILECRYKSNAYLFVSTESDWSIWLPRDVLNRVVA